MFYIVLSCVFTLSQIFKPEGIREYIEDILKVTVRFKWSSIGGDMGNIR